MQPCSVASREESSTREGVHRMLIWNAWPWGPCEALGDGATPK